MNIKEIVESKEPPEGSLAAQMMATARGLGMNPRLRGTPDEERKRTNDIMAQRERDRIHANKMDPEELAKIESELEEIVKTYKLLGGSNWQYADREQNLSDAERRARDLETKINALHRRIQAAKEANQHDLDEDAPTPTTVKYGMPGFSDEEQLDERSVSKAQFRTMAAAAHNPEFAKKVDIDQSTAKEFHSADRKHDYKSLPKKAQ